MLNLPATKYPTTQRTVTGATLVYEDDVVLNCDTSTGPVTIDLAKIPDNFFSTQYKLYIVDSGNNASVNNITINAGAGQTINTAAFIKISTNKGSVVVTISNNTTYTGLVSNTVANNDFIPVTYVQLTNLINTKTIIPNGDYLLLDAIFYPSLFPTKIYLKGITTSEVSLDGQGIFFNADYQSVGVYTGITGFASQLGLWDPILVTPLNSVVIWNNIHFLNKTGLNGLTNPELDTVNWQVLPRQENYGYIIEIDSILYNSATNRIVYRLDKRGNQVELTNIGGFNSFNVFKWGSDKVKQNSVLKNSILNNRNLNIVTEFFANQLADSVLNFGTTNVQGSVTNFSHNEFNNSSLAATIEVYECLNNVIDNSTLNIYFTTAFSKFNENSINLSNFTVSSSTGEFSKNQFTNVIFNVASSTSKITENIVVNSQITVTVGVSNTIENNNIRESNLAITEQFGTMNFNVFQNVQSSLIKNSGDISYNIMSNVPVLTITDNTGLINNNDVENVQNFDIITSNQGVISNNVFLDSIGLILTNNNAGGEILNNSMITNGSMIITTNRGRISNNSLQNAGTLTVIQNQPGAKIVNVILSNNSELNIGTNDGQIGTSIKNEGVIISIKSIVNLVTITSTGFFAGINITNNSNFKIQTLNTEVLECNISGGIFDIFSTTFGFNVSRLNCVNVDLGASGTLVLTENLRGTAMQGVNTITFTLDCSNPAIYDLPTQTLTIPGDVSTLGGRYILSNAGGLTISKISNLERIWNTIFEPDNGIVTFQSIPVAGAIVDDIVSPNGAFNYNLTYRLQGSDYVQIIKREDFSMVSNAVILT
jgi:hypothetical protein